MSSSRLSQRNKKQEKYRRHIASLTSAKDENEDRNVSESRSRSPSPPYNPIKSGKIRYIASKEDAKEAKEEGEVKEEFKKKYRNKIVNQRTGRSLTRSSGPNSRSSSMSSQASTGSQEPGRIMPRPRPGRSLTRSTEGRSLPTARSLSKSKPPVPASTSNEASNEEASRPVLMTLRARSRSRARSTSRDPEPKIEGNESMESTNNTSFDKKDATSIRPLSRRSPFSKLLAEKKANVGTLKKKPKGGKSPYDVKSTKSAAKAEDPAPKEKDAAAIAAVETKSPPVEQEEEKPTKSPAKESVDEAPALVDESEDLPSDEDSTKEAVKNATVLSKENVEKHTGVEEKGEIVDEYGDPELVEMESEVTVNTDLQVNTDLDNVIQNYMTSNSLLATLATSPVQEVTSPVSEVSSAVPETKEKAIETEEKLTAADTKVASPAQEKETSIDAETDVSAAAQEPKEEKPVETDTEVSSPVQESKEKSVDAETANEEKKETEDEEDSVPPALKAWDLASPKFANFTPSQDEEFDPVDFDEDVWENKETSTAVQKVEATSEKVEATSEKVEAEPVEEPTKESSSPKGKTKSTDTYDMFDTSSWAAGTVSDFSNTPFSNVEMDINADKNFVKMMKEEMKFRTLTEEEQKLMFEAQEKINQAEEKAKEEVAAQKDDEPLIVQRSDSNSVEAASEAGTGVSLEDRLKTYATVEPDSDSAKSSDSEDQDSSGDEAEVEYVDQNNEEEPAQEPKEGDVTGTEEAPINLVGSDDVPTLEVAASAASLGSIPPIPATLSEFKRSGPPPPPPPPGLPKKKKRKKKKKSKESSGEKKIPLLPPPSEEKLKNWKGDQQKAQDFVAAMAERLANTATKALDASSEYFDLKESAASNDNEDAPVENNSVDEAPAKVEAEDTKDDVKEIEKAEDTDDVPQEADKQNNETPEDDSVAEFAKKVQRENEETVLHTTEKNNLWKKEVDDAMGLVERLEEEYDNGAFPELTQFPSPLSDEEIPKPPTVSDEEIAKNVSEQQEPATSASQDSKELVGEDIENKNETSTPDEKCSEGAPQSVLTVDVLSSPKGIDRQESLFASPKSTKAIKGNAFDEKTKTSSIGSSILTDSKMADKIALASSAAANTFEQTFTPRNAPKIPKEFESLAWFTKQVLKKEFTTQASEVDVSTAAQLLLEDKDNFNAMCRIVAESVNEVSLEINPGLKTSSSFDTAQLMSRSLSTAASGDPLSNKDSMSTASSGDSEDKSSHHKRILLRPVVLTDAAIKLSGKYLAANFVSFLFMASKLAKVSSPFGDKNPFLAMIVESSMETIGVQESSKSTQELIFEQLDGKVEKLIEFAYSVQKSCQAEKKSLKEKPEDSISEIEQTNQSTEEADTVVKSDSGKRFIVPESHPSPFETSVVEAPRIVAAVLSFLGDPVAVCTVKKVNKKCHQIVSQNEHTLMQDAVRSGGIDSRHRPAFWIHVALEKSDNSNRVHEFDGVEELKKLETTAEEGKWHHVIKRDVDRSFGNLPPHKTGAKFQSDSIVAALVTWGQSRLMKRGVKGGGEPVPIPEIGDQKEKTKRQATNLSSPPWSNDGKEDGDDEKEDSPTDIASDSGAVSPKSANDADDKSSTPNDSSMEDIALCGNSLSADEKADLQKKLSFILHTLAASYEDIGYCQGMDYVVAHLLRNLQGTIRLKAANKRLPAIVSTASALSVTEDVESLNKDIDSNHVVEETIVRMIDTFFVNYNLKHMYWPELRCLKTCCRVFERLIQIKLPVLADHFEHHDLNVGLFALGWFQTLFLYLPSMPSATVCHMWDIWLVERSFKIFFRVGTAILFLSQPILLNHELEGMMTYLNTIPDATLLRPDILIPCALNIKVTNRLLQELEDELMKDPN